MFENTIAAISTSLQDGAISIIRLSGDKAIEITQKIFDRNIMDAKSHTIHYGFIIDADKNPVDEVLISIFRAPKTYTREDIVEINCHGGTFITRKILSMVLSAGADLAKPGEFTQRAFYHGRIDLSQAEAVQDMIEASNNTAASMAIHGIKGSVKKLLQPLIDDLMDIIAQIEVNIDYPEYEDVEQMKQVALVDERIEKIANQFLPGALTLVVNVKESVDSAYTNGLSTIAIRIPDEKFILDVIDELNCPILVTSANQSGEKTALTSDDVYEQLPKIDGIVLGTCKALQASTIVDCTKENLQILRPGPISLEELESVL